MGIRIRVLSLVPMYYEYMVNGNYFYYSYFIIIYESALKKSLFSCNLCFFVKEGHGVVFRKYPSPHSALGCCISI